MNIKIKNKTLSTVMLLCMLASSTSTVIAEELKSEEPPTIEISDSKTLGKCGQSEIVKELRIKAADSEEDPLKRIVKKGDVCAAVSSEGEVNSIDLENTSKATDFLKAQVAKAKAEKEAEEAKKLSFDRIVEVVMSGEYGNGEERKAKLEAEGYDFALIQARVVELTPEPEPVAAVAPAVRSMEAPAQTNGNVIQAYPHGTFKSYMSWHALSSSSPQGQLSAKASPDPSTAIMMYEGRYLVALGFAYADHVGQHIDVVMQSGAIIPVIVGDFKAREHTDQWNSASLNNGSIIEFIVSSNSEAAYATNGTGSYDGIFPGQIKEFRK